MAEHNRHAREDRWEREKKALALHSRGATLEQIASEIGCSVQTVKMDLKIVYKRVTDMLILDGTAVGEMLSGIRTIVRRETMIAEQAVKVREIKITDKGEPEMVHEPDYYARTNADSKILEAWRLMATILGFGKTEQSPLAIVVNQNIGQQNIMGGGNGTPQIDEKDVPVIRKHLRELRRLMHQEQVSQVDDPDHAVLKGVKEVPEEVDLHGVLLDIPPAKDDGRGAQAIEAEAEVVDAGGASEPGGHQGDDTGGNAGGRDDDRGADSGTETGSDTGLDQGAEDGIGVSYQELKGDGW